MLHAAILSSSSLVIVPNLSGLTPSAANAALSAVGLSTGSTSSTSSGATSGNNGTVASQSVAAGSLVERYSSVGYTTYSYSPPPPPANPPVWVDSSIVNSFTKDTAYSDSVSATNGANYSWEQVGSVYPFWPDGVTISNSTGVISGTPTTAGQQYSFRIIAYNSGGTITSGTYSGTVGSPSGGGGGGQVGLSLGVTISTPTSPTSLSGSVFADNTTTGASYSVSLSTSAGSISPSSFVINGYQSTNTPFSVSGLSAGQTVTVTATSVGASASNTATTTNPPTVTYTYYFDIDLGQPSVPPNAELMTSGSKYTAQSGNITINAGSGCGTQTFFAFTSGTWYWICYRIPN